MYKVTKYAHSTFSWADNTSADEEVAKAFYVDLLGWEYFDADSGYIFIINRGRRNGGFLALDESFDDMPTH